MDTDPQHYDWIVVGSGFGGSVSALRLVEKGYRVLLVEKGRRFDPSDYPRTNWDLRRWLWMPLFRWRGLFRMTFFRHLTVFSGVGVGGGSLVYACTLPTPQDEFFEAPSWSALADWKKELSPHYPTALKMLGATEVPITTPPDERLAELGREMGREEHFHPSRVSIYFGEKGKTVSDPYFDGEGPERTGCVLCGGCMLGCRHGAKNSLDQNYLYLAEKQGLEILPETEVIAVRPLEKGGYRVEAKEQLGWLRQGPRSWTADHVVFSGGVLGTVDLLSKLRSDSEGLPDLSPRLGDFVRTNSESLTAITSARRDEDLSKGVAIGSILHTDDHSHLEPVRYPPGSGFFRILTAPHAPGPSAVYRLLKSLVTLFRHPIRHLRSVFVSDWARYTTVLLYMRTLEGTIQLRRRRWPWSGLRSHIAPGQPPPTAHMPEATELAERYAEKVDSVVHSLLTETILGTPSTAHILGGCCMGETAEEGVIDANHRVFGYDGLYVIDGSAVSANPGVNPSLTITALAERAMSKIAPKEGAA